MVALLAHDLEGVERLLRESLGSRAPLLEQVGGSLLLDGGKRIRPLLALAAARACGGGGERAQRMAAAVELIHTASLLHDDVVDQATLRRGRPSANARFGISASVLAGDFLYGQAVLTVAELDDPSAMAVLASTLKAMAEGEVLQLDRGTCEAITEADYEAVVERKTGALMAAATEGGARVACDDPALHAALAAYGRDLGLAFQIVDDALDYVGTEAGLGKAPLADLADGTITLPLVYALEACTPEEREAVVGAVGTLAADAEARAYVAGVVERRGGIERALDRAHEVADLAVSHLSPLPDGPGRDALVHLAAFVTVRAT